MTVSEVLPNGILAVRGEKWMTLNTGDELVRIAGLVRQDDIATDNTVSSTRIADARITYSGTGAFADASQPGWLDRFFAAPVAVLTGADGMLKKMLLLTGLLFVCATTQAERLKDVATIHGVRANQLIGYGLVVGLNGSGDQTTDAAVHRADLQQHAGAVRHQVPSGGNIQLKNVAAVSIHAELPPFAKPGQTIDITVSSIGNAKSLRGGSLLMAPLKDRRQRLRRRPGQPGGRRFRCRRRGRSRVTVSSPSAGASPAARPSSGRCRAASIRAIR